MKQKFTEIFVLLFYGEIEQSYNMLLFLQYNIMMEYSLQSNIYFSGHVPQICHVIIILFSFLHISMITEDREPEQTDQKPASEQTLLWAHISLLSTPLHSRQVIVLSW